ncbi:Hint domain-containing protein [Aquicoccus porphyridii]|uniref:Hint domain-containing protein n=1 Tax=Aquicoccus porphyridii TaxID=1852029 RepID=A0A5A9Z4M7_9RHOB|nr:Hint domain-containing protein [Aquicoccus porphyridii]KAA0912072.1 Hint domain-containing protein [Aquicoccus porphyridii]RAI53073.1 hemolysin-type calcium-binding protein [Rhodobacteraceae bacterium AsT-22]
MKTGFRGTFVISWSQTEVDGLGAAPVYALNVGATWLWRGEAVRVDGPGELLRLEQADGEQNIRKRAARVVHRLVGAAVHDRTRLEDVEPDRPLLDNNFVVTDGSRSYTVTLINVAPGQPPLLMFFNDMPPCDREFWVVYQSYEGPVHDPAGPDAGGVICFTPGTRIETPEGPRRVEDLREGDRVQTKDNGAQDVLWIGSRRMTGARLFAMPRLRPVRIRAGALGVGRPDEELIVSPEHRMVVKGSVARALFNTDEVLVRAKDMVNGRDVVTDSQLREVTYVHLLLPAHQVVWANGVETESFHPANTAISTLGARDRERLLRRFPAFEYSPRSYGDYARRNLSESEAAIMRHEAA